MGSGSTCRVPADGRFVLSDRSRAASLESAGGAIQSAWLRRLAEDRHADPPHARRRIVPGVGSTVG
ncbi:hypothetical protein THIOKS12480015 [Thiocapsa sp. KS1]|nr:hypothetical protein THIOKS12480015 [Thiocapsa sp. KS1]